MTKSQHIGIVAVSAEGASRPPVFHLVDYAAKRADIVCSFAKSGVAFCARATTMRPPTTTAAARIDARFIRLVYSRTRHESTRHASTRHASTQHASTQH